MYKKNRKKMTIELPEEIKEKLEVMAESNHLSMTSIIIFAINKLSRDNGGVL